MDPWRSIGDQILVAPTHSFRSIVDPQQKLHSTPLRTLTAINKLGPQLTYRLTTIMVFGGRSKISCSNVTFGIAPWKRRLN
jgi:hypothetical protein